MSSLLSPGHFAYTWPIDERFPIEHVTSLGATYHSLPEGPEQEGVLLDIVKAFHPYLMKYVEMIVRGYLPIKNNRVNPDSQVLLRFFAPRGSQPTRALLHQICKTLHLAFKQQAPDEVYNVLSSILMVCVRRYDPGYTDRVREVIGAIFTLTGDAEIRPELLGLAFDPTRYLKLLVKHGFLSMAKNCEGGLTFSRALWPPPRRFMKAKPIGLAYHVQRMFRQLLQKYITSQMRQVEMKDGVFQLEHRRSSRHESKGTLMHAPVRFCSDDFALPAAVGKTSIPVHRGRGLAADVSLVNTSHDLSEMNSRWIASTKDPLFAGLTPLERRILYLHFGKDLGWKQIASACQKRIKTVQDIYAKCMLELQAKAGVVLK